MPYIKGMGSRKTVIDILHFTYIALSAIYVKCKISITVHITN